MPGLLAGFAVALMMLALVLSYGSSALLDPQRFADRAVATLQDPAVSGDVADRLTNAVVAGRGEDLVAVRPDPFAHRLNHAGRGVRRSAAPRDRRRS